MKSDIGNIVIRSIAAAIPKNVSYFDDELNNYSHSESSSLKLKKLMGYNQHHVVKTDAKLTDLVSPILQSLKENVGVDYSEVDALIVVTQTPDYHIPSTSSILHGSFPFSKECYCLDVNDGCNGYIRGLFESSCLIRNTNYKNILLVSGDVLSRKVSIRDRNSYPLIGDAVTVSLIQRNDSPSSAPISIMQDGTGHKALQIPAGGLAEMADESTLIEIEDSEGNFRSRQQLVMQGRDVFTFTQTVVIDFLNEFISEHCPDKNINYYFLHQANEFILQRIRSSIGASKDSLPSDVIHKYGNSSSATVPLSLVDKFLNNGEEPLGKCLLAGFGVGLSWGAILISLDCFDKCKIIEVDL